MTGTRELQHSCLTVNPNSRKDKAEHLATEVANHKFIEVEEHRAIREQDVSSFVVDL